MIIDNAKIVKVVDRVVTIVYNNGFDTLDFSVNLWNHRDITYMFMLSEGKSFDICLRRIYDNSLELVDYDCVG
jgi:hypothetical protein